MAAVPVTFLPDDGDVDNVLEERGDPDNPDVPQHIPDIEEMVDEIVVDPTYEAENFVRQFSPEGETDQGLVHDKENRDDNVLQDQDDRDDLSTFLQAFIYDQSRQPKKKDIVFFYDLNERDFVRVRVLSKSNYRYYYNIQYLDVEKPDTGIWFRPNDFWSHILPTRREAVQEHHDGGLPEAEVDVLPPPEQEREGGARPLSRNVSPLTTYASLRSDRVCHLLVD